MTYLFIAGDAYDDFCFGARSILDLALVYCVTFVSFLDLVRALFVLNAVEESDYFITDEFLTAGCDRHEPVEEGMSIAGIYVFLII